MSFTAAKKLIEVSIPLKEINEACAREKSIRHGHPSTLHLWWARRPLAAARAVLFCQLVDDPSGYVDELEKANPRKSDGGSELLGSEGGSEASSPKRRQALIEKERDRLHKLVKELVIWENTTNEDVLKRARKEIQATWKRHLRRDGLPENTPMPPVLDPFAGGGAIPLEAQRLGMEAHASDLNPVAVLINRAMIEIPPKFAGMPPVHAEWQEKSKEEKAANVWKGAQGLADDVRYFGQWMREEAEKRIGELYPPYELTQELLDQRPDLVKSGYQAGEKLTVIAWLWARTVPSPNPALQGKPVPLVSSFWLSKKAGKEAYVEPVIENGDYRFEIRVGKPEKGKLPLEETVNRQGGVCLISGAPMSFNYIREQGQHGKMFETGFAVVCEGNRGRVYLPASSKMTEVPEPTWKPEDPLPHNPRDFKTPNYGMKTYGDLFTSRQLVALTTFSDLVGEARDLVLQAASTAGHLPQDDRSLEQGGTGPQAYADAVAVYLAFSVDRCADYWSTVTRWQTANQQLSNTFGRQAIPMTWDYPEANPFSRKGGSFDNLFDWTIQSIEHLPCLKGVVSQDNASTRLIQQDTIISSDPPYYDNIGYADLSDFFYVWLRRTLRLSMPIGLASIMVPKAEELIAAPYRQGSKSNAESFFLEGMTQVAIRWTKYTNSYYPTTIYYAFKQSETRESGNFSTGWATFLGALISAGFSIVGTWPMRMEMKQRVLALGTNALASSIVLVCRQRPETAETVTRREFIEALEEELPAALKELQQANLSPVDLPQSAIGPGMAIFSRYAKIYKNDGQAMTVTEALQLINHELSHLLDGQVADMDPYTRFASKWFAQHGFQAGTYGDAELIATATNVSVNEVQQAGILESARGSVRILKPEELPSDWTPEGDKHRTVWEVVHHLIRLMDSAGDSACIKVLAGIPHQEASEARQLCYRLFTVCDQNGWSQEAQAYNQLISEWQYYTDQATKVGSSGTSVVQGSFDL